MARGGVWKTHLRLQVICDSKHFLWGIQSAKKSAITWYDYLNTVQSIHLNFHVWLQDPWLFWMCLLVGDSSGVGRTMCVTATLWFTCLFVFFPQIAHLPHLPPSSTVAFAVGSPSRSGKNTWLLTFVVSQTNKISLTFFHSFGQNRPGMRKCDQINESLKVMHVTTFPERSFTLNYKQSAEIQDGFLLGKLLMAKRQ